MKRIVIVGATSAIAAACARLWVAKGAKFFLVARDATRLAAVAADLRLRGAAHVAVHVLDARQTDAHAAMLSDARAELGEIDLALIAHGSLPDQASCERDPQQMLAELATNGGSVMALLSGLAEVLEAQGHGRLVVITSVAGDRGRPSNYVYGAAKAAVSTFCEGLRARLFKRGVSLTEVRPGFVDTPMTQGLALPQALVSSPERVARCIVAASEHRRDIVYAPGYWALIMLVIRCIPRFLFKRMRL